MVYSFCTRIQHASTWFIPGTCASCYARWLRELTQSYEMSLIPWASSSRASFWDIVAAYGAEVSSASTAQ